MNTTSPRSTRTRRMRVARLTGLLAAASALGIAAACAPESATAPDMSSRAVTLDQTALNGVNTVLAQGLIRNVALPTALTASATVGKLGGTIEIPAAGFKLKIPAGAIPQGTMKITVTSMPGSMVAYDFQPHGARFAIPLEFEQTLAGTSWEKLGLKTTLTGGYFKDNRQLNLAAGTAELDELFEITVKSSKATFGVPHFSGYMVSTGRSGSRTDAAQ